MKLTTEVKGLDRTNRILRTYGKSIRRNTVPVIQKAARNGERFMRRKAPEQTGELKRSISSQVFPATLRYLIQADTRYAIYAEYQKFAAGGGTRPEENRLWLTRTLKRQFQFLRRQMRKVVAATNEKHARGASRQ